MVDTETAIKFLSGKGAVRVLMTLGAEEHLHRKEILQEVNIAGKTLDSRLKQAEKAGLIAKDYDPHSRYDRLSYILTPAGIRLRLLMLDLGLEEAYIRLRAYEMEVKEITEQVRDQVAKDWPDREDKIGGAVNQQSVNPLTQETLTMLYENISLPGIHTEWST